jgi:ABC-type protease/lipase transport system fused ATPase/permease subunit
LLALVSRIMLIERGRVAMDGPRDEVLKQITRQSAPPTKAA